MICDMQMMASLDVFGLIFMQERFETNKVHG